jgi:hypothetical protein
MIKLKAASGKVLAREEWDFSACPDNRLYFCFSYEFAREVARKTPTFRTRFEKAPKDEFDEAGNWHYMLTGPEDENHHFEFLEIIDAPTGFPDKPYLSLNHQITRRSYHPFQQGFPFVAQLEPIREVHFDGRTFHSGDLAEQMNLLPYDFHSLQIDWSYPTSEIMRAIQQWLESQRPSPPQQRRGHNAARYYRRALKELGAARLIEACGSVGDAWTYTVDLGVNDWNGLFTQEHEWYTARKRTDEIVKEWQQAFDYLENAATSA